MRFIENISRRLQKWDKYPFEDMQSSNIFVSSFLLNAIILVAIIVTTIFTGYRTESLQWFYGMSQVVGLFGSIIALVKFNRVKKMKEAGLNVTNEEFLAANYRTAFLFYWVIGLVLSSFAVILVYWLISKFI